MPAYFEMDLIFKREDIYPKFVGDFYNHLDESGLKFKSGYWGFENDSLEDTISWNQQKLENNFQLGLSEHHSHDYKQTVYEYGGFSEVRGFWLNNCPQDDEFTFLIIIPEDEILDFSKELFPFRKDSTEKILTLAKAIYKFPLIQTIQTGLESPGGSIQSLPKIKNGTPPLTEPFAVIPCECLERLKTSDYEVHTIERNGAVIIRNSVYESSY